MIYLNKLKRNEDTALFIVDMLMMLLVLLNLGLILIEWFYDSVLIRDLFATYMPDLYQKYTYYIHRNFIIIDLSFVGIFITELLIRWAVAAHKRVYHRWFFYPFVHWYDVLGSIPLGSFRFLRILRVFSILYRLDKMGVIRLRETYIYSRVKKYYGILVEEVSDRVVVNVLNGVQKEVEKGSPLVDKIIKEVIVPQQDILVEWLARRIRKTTANLHTRYQSRMRYYLSERVTEAIKNNKDLEAIALIPLVGDNLSLRIKGGVSQVVYDTINGIIEDMAKHDNREVVKHASEAVFEDLIFEQDYTDLNEIVRQISLETLEQVKEQVKIQQWKINDEAGNTAPNPDEESFPF
ncbi:MAG: hypothetical protein JJT94_03930 [Bernardetiaceae bacterium]|nr:hypothetical protein [Bernardetiaceae bacterium]